MMKDNYFARSPRPNSLTPHYKTAKPVVSLASDGLWDRMESEQAVMLVGKWFAKRANRSLA